MMQPCHPSPNVYPGTAERKRRAAIGGAARGRDRAQCDAAIVQEAERRVEMLGVERHLEKHLPRAQDGLRRHARERT